MTEKLINLLIDNNLHISCAESCTGGLIVSKIVGVSNASKVLDMSFVTYANEAKVKYLNVDKNTIERYGVVSEEVTYEMSRGLHKETLCDVGICVSGIAGPTGGSKEKPVGMVCFGFYINGKIITETKYFKNEGRNIIRENSANYAIEEAYNLLKESLSN
jgi:PncC family amidohydrolase